MSKEEILNWHYSEWYCAACEWRVEEHSARLKKPDSFLGRHICCESRIFYRNELIGRLDLDDQLQTSASCPVCDNWMKHTSLTQDISGCAIVIDESCMSDDREPMPLGNYMPISDRLVFESEIANPISGDPDECLYVTNDDCYYILFPWRISVIPAAIVMPVTGDVAAGWLERRGAWAEAALLRDKLLELEKFFHNMEKYESQQRFQLS